MKSTYNMSLFCLLNIMSGNNDCCSCTFNQFKEMLPNSINKRNSNNKDV